MVKNKNIYILITNSTLFFLALLLINLRVYGNEIKSQVISLENNLVLAGAYEEKSIYFETKSYWDLIEAKAQINFEISPMILDTPASLTLKLNGEPIYSLDLNYENGQSQSISLNIPKEKLNSGFNSFTISGFAQIYDEDGCIDEYAKANWVIFQKDSSVEINYTMKTPSYEVSEYPYSLFYNTDDSNTTDDIDLSIVVPDNATNGELTAATWVKADLSSYLDSVDNINIEYYSKSKSSSSVLVSLYENLSQKEKEIVDDKGITQSNLDKNGAIIINPEEEKCQIIIVSNNDLCLLEASQFLMDNSRTSQEKSSVVLVPLGSGDKLKENLDIGSTEYSIADWSGNVNGIEVKGSFHNEYTIYPPDNTTHVLGTDDLISTNFRYSKNLDFTRSLLTIYINGQPVGSKKLDIKYADGDNLDLYIPEDLSGQVLESVTFAFDLEVENMDCPNYLSDIPWAFISNNSYLSLTGTQNNFLTFDTTPWPYIENGYANNILFVLPSTPTDTELETLSIISGMYGKSMKPYGNMEVKYFDNINKSVITDSNIIWIGTFENKNMINTVNNHLSFTIDMSNNSFNGNNRFEFSQSYATSVATLQLIPSIYNQENTMLVVTAPDDESLKYANEYLSFFNNQNSLENDTVIIDSNLEMRSFKFYNQGSISGKPKLRETLEKNKESIYFAVSATSIMFILLIASILIFIRTRAENNRGDE